MSEDAQKITPGKLQKVGLWEEFCDIRERGFADGMSAKDAHAKALKEITPIYNTTSLDSSSTASKKPSGKKKRRRATCSEDEFSDNFLSREAGIVEVIVWVAKNLETPKGRIKAEDAPSPEAWGMLSSYRASCERKDDFWDKIYVRLIPSKAQIESLKIVGELDGANIARTIDRILKLNEKVASRSMTSVIPKFSESKPSKECKRKPKKWKVKKNWKDTDSDKARIKRIEVLRQEAREKEWQNSPTII